MRNAATLLALLLAPLACLAKDSGKAHLCEPDERVAFSCTISKKVASLCATRDLSATSGRLTYRFGVPGQRPELEYPAAQVGAMAAFGAQFESWAKGSYQAVQFTRGDYVYTVYNRRAAFEADERSNGGGVSVHQQGKQIADLWCKESSIEDNMWALLKDLGLPPVKGW